MRIEKNLSRFLNKRHRFSPLLYRIMEYATTEEPCFASVPKADLLSELATMGIRRYPNEIVPPDDNSLFIGLCQLQDDGAIFFSGWPREPDAHIEVVIVANSRSKYETAEAFHRHFQYYFFMRDKDVLDTAGDLHTKLEQYLAN